MLKFVNSGAKATLVKAARYAATSGLLLAAGFLVAALPGRAGAGITNSITFVNDTDVPITPMIDGHEYGPVEPGAKVTLSCTDGSDEVTTLGATGDDFENKIFVSENRNRPVWVVSEDDLRDSPR